MSSFDQLLPSIIKSLKSTYGKDFFNSLVQQLHLAIGADYTFIARIDETHFVSKTISLVAHGEIADNFEYALQGTPCADVTQDSICIYPKDVCQYYPDDQLLIDMKIAGYIGVPLHDSAGKVVGIIVALYEEEIANQNFVTQLFELFAGRISAELERSEKEQLLKEFNRNLEKTVKARTSELTEALEHLTDTQEKLLEQQKMASLGNLVAGVAHEINTPLGVAILSSSNINESAVQIQDKLSQGTLKKSDLERYLATITESAEGLDFNLHRAAELVANFKQVAVERNTDEIQEIQLYDWFNTIHNSLKPMVEKHQVLLHLHHPEEHIVFKSYASMLSQIIVNLVTNCTMHAFPQTDNVYEKKIDISYLLVKNTLQITVKDNGSGIEAHVKPHIFEPFYTSKRGEGGTGLGLSIVNNIVRGRLAGEIDVFSNENQGSEFLITLPILE